MEHPQTIVAPPPPPPPPPKNEELGRLNNLLGKRAWNSPFVKVIDVGGTASSNSPRKKLENSYYIPVS